jgi:membrane protein
MSKFITSIVQIYNFIRYDIWRITENELSHSRRSLYRFLKTLVLAVRGFINDDLNVRASALTYSVLFAIIPLFALIFAIGKGFGVDKLIENSFQDTFIGQSDMIPAIMGFVDRYLKTTQGGIFIGVGIAILYASRAGIQSYLASKRISFFYSEVLHLFFGYSYCSTDNCLFRGIINLCKLCR